MPGAKRKRLDICSECKHAAKPAINAAKLGHAQCLTTAYRDLGAFNERDDFGATPIHFAARFGKLECLTWLVTRSGVSPNAVSRNGSTAAHDAAAMGHLDCLQYLLENTKCSRQDTTSEGATVLHMACRFGRLEVVKWLMAFSNSSPSEKGANNVTPVHLCAAKNNLACLQYLTQHPQYVPNEQTAHGATPVYFAAQEGCLESLQWLAEHGGGDLYCTASDGMAPIHAAAQAGQTSCLQWLVEEGGVPIRYKAEDGATAAHFAAASGQVECLDWIIDHGGSISDRDNLGGTPVHDAAEQGQLSALKYLMNRDVDMAAEDYEGMKPLDLARDNNHEECVKLLFKTVKPSILLSLTPHQSLSRGASKAEEDEALERAEKQRKFEEAMLSGVSAERREAIWQSAQQRATVVQPGLKQILDGEAVASPSSLSLEGQQVQAGDSSMQITPVGSLRHSRHSTGRRSPKPPVTNDFEPDDIQSYKPRPPLSPTIFQMPSQDEVEPSEPKKSKTAATSGDLPGSPTDEQPATMLQPPLSPLRKVGLDKSSNSPIPERAKFIKKLKGPGKNEHTPRVASPTTNEDRSLSPATTSPQKTKQPSSPETIPPGGKRAKSPPPKKQAPAPKKPTGKRPTSPAPKKPATAPGKRPTSPAPKKPTTAPGKRPTSPPPNKPTGKRPTSPAPKKPTDKRPTSPAPKKPTTAPGKRPTSPAPNKPTGKRPTSPAPKKPTTAPGKRPTSPPPNKPTGKRPTSPAPDSRKPTTAPGKRPTSPAPKKPVSATQKTEETASGAKKPASRPTSPPPKQPVSGQKKTGPPQKPPADREQIKKKQAEVKRSSLPPKSPSEKEAVPKRPVSVAVSPKDTSKSVPPNVKRSSAPPRSLSPTGNQKKMSATRKAPSPPPERGRSRAKEQGMVRRVVSPTGKKADQRSTQPPVKKAVTKAPKRPAASKQGAVKSSKAKLVSKKKANQQRRKVKQSVPTTGQPKQSEEESKDTAVTMLAALDNFPSLDTGAPPVEADNITKQANKAIEQLLNKSLLQPDNIPVSATTEEESPPEEQQPESSEEEPEEKREEEAYKQFANKMASSILEESLVEQGDEPKSSLPEPTDEVSPAVTDMNEVVMRKKTDEKPLQPRISSYKEGVVISKPPERKSLKTNDETVTVTFVTKSSNVKRPFPVTHHQLITEDDLESPGASDEEGAQRESFTTPGFDRLDMNTFEDFGTDVKKRRTVEEESFSRESEKMGTIEKEDIVDVRKALNLEEAVATDRIEEEAIDDKVEDKRLRSASDGDKLETEDEDVALDNEPPSQDGGLTRWSNRQSLDIINHAPAPSEDVVSAKEDNHYASPSEVYQKLQKFDLQKKERGYTDVLKMVDRFQGNRRSQNEPLDEPEESDKSGSGGISDRLKMFGGRASFITPPAPKTPASTFAQKMEPDMHGSKVRSRSESSSPATSREASPGRSRNLTRRSSSCLSVTAFETIAEEDTSGAESDASKTEDIDKFTPLPKIHPGLHRRLSEERLRLDGLNEDSLSASKSDTALIPGPARLSPRVEQRQGSKQYSGNKTPSPPEMRLRRHSGSAVYSPLMKSSSPVARKKEDKPKIGRPLSMPASPPRGSEALSLFMNSANLPHLNHLKERHERDQTKLAEERVSLLLSKPRYMGEAVPFEFQGLDFKEKDNLYIWKQKAGSLHRLGSLDSVNFEPKATFIFLYIASRGPLLYHVYLWVGSNVSDFARQSVYQHCQRLVACTPGRPVLHREFQSHESVSFMSVIKEAGKKLSDYHTSLLNVSLKGSKLYTFKTSDSSFEEVQDLELGGEALAKLRVPVILDTPTSVFLWLPKSYWDEGEQKQSAFDISELFIVQNRYPKWTPVTVVTDQVETEQFVAHFSSWPWVDLQLDERAEELYLPSVQAPAVSYPATGQTKVWQLVDHELVVGPIDKIGHFDSSGLFVVQYAYLKQSALYTWMEGTVYLWVGEGVGGERDVLVREALDKVETVGPTKLPIVIVPEGHEPTQLLNLYKGKFVIHKHNGATSEPSCRLYEVSGTGILSMKAAEVTPKASSLHSGHTYILLGPQGEYVWSGQFSNQAQRRGALLIAKALNKSKDLIKLAEGLEIQEFWDDLGGKTKYSHFSKPVSPSYILPRLYLCEVNKGTLLFKELPPMNKEDMKSSQCYFFVYKKQILVWQGNKWKMDTPPTNLVQTYISRYHSRRTEREFVVTLVTEGKEGEMFWKWFDMQNPTVTTPTNDPKPTAEAEKEAALTIEDLEETDSLVIVTDTPHLSEKPLPDIELEDSRPDPVEDPSITIRDPPAVHSISLTQSQEVAFEKVEKLKAELDDLVERESEGSGDDQPDGMTAGSKGEEIQTSPIRTSETMKQVSDMINGLDNILHSNSGAALQETPPLESVASAVSLQSPSVGNLMETSEDFNLSTPPAKTKKAKKQPVSPAPKPPPSLLITVEIDGTNSSVEVRVREKAPVITVMFRAAQQAGHTLSTKSALFEVSESLKLYRALEDHELIRDVMSLWPKRDKPKLLLRNFATKNVLWSDNPPLPKSAINAYIKSNTVPNISAQLQHCSKGVAKLPWREDNFSLRPVGVYSLTETKKKGPEVNLSTSLDHVLYIPMVVNGKFHTTPTPFCFAMKPPTSWREKDLTLYCAPSLPVMSKWIHAIRLFKHGIQLKANYIAMKTRVQKQGKAEGRDTSQEQKS